MSLATALANARAAAERRMVDRCVIRRGATVLYGGDGNGKCEITQDPGEAQEEGDAYALDLRLVLKLPMSVSGLQRGDEATLTVSVHDQDLVGRVLRIQGVHHESHAKARELYCTERTNASVYLRGDSEGEWTT